MLYTLIVSWVDEERYCILSIQKSGALIREIMVAISPPVRADRQICSRVLGNLATIHSIPEAERISLQTQLEEEFQQRVGATNPTIVNHI